MGKNYFEAKFLTLLQSGTHQYVVKDSEADASELLENLEEMFPRYLY